MENFILLAEDDNDSRGATKLLLEDKGYRVHDVQNGMEALEYIKKNGPVIDIVIIDRQMPVMSGVEFIHELKQSEYSYIPAILLTGSNSQVEITQGIKAGAYSYIIKPAKIDLIDSVVKAAITDMEHHKTLNEMATQQRDLKVILSDMHLKLKTFKQARSLSRFLSGFYPEPQKAILGVYEIIVNAIEHGNLGISFEHKKELIQNAKWDEEIVKRQNSDEYYNRYVKISFHMSDDMIQLEVEDEGSGFNWSEFVDITSVKPNEPSGRGILMARQISFDKIEYIGKGNKVICYKNIK